MNEPTVQIDPSYYDDLASQIAAFAGELKLPADLHIADGFIPSAYPESEPLGLAITGANEAVLNWNNGVVQTLNYVSAFLHGVAQIFPHIDQQKATEIEAALKKVRNGIVAKQTAS